MSNSKNNSLRNIRKPYEQASEPAHVRFVAVEIAVLADQAKQSAIAGLARSIVSVLNRSVKGVHDCMVPRVVTYDLETLATIEEAGGWECHDKLGISVLCAHDSATGQYLVFSDVMPDKWRELYDVRPLAEFQKLAQSASFLVGFNSSRFDRKVVEAMGFSLPDRDYDLLIEGWKGQGIDVNAPYSSETHGGGLMDYATANLEIGKSGDGVLAAMMWQQGKIREVIEYCLLDVRLTRRLFELIQVRGWLDNPKTRKRVEFRKV